MSKSVGSFAPLPGGRYETITNYPSTYPSKIQIMWKSHFYYEPRHVKTYPKIFVVVIPKEGLGPTNPSLSMTPTIKLHSATFRLYSLQSVSYQKNNWRVPARHFFFWYENDKDLKACFPMTRLIRVSLSIMKAGNSPCFYISEISYLKWQISGYNVAKIKECPL